MTRVAHGARDPAPGGAAPGSVARAVHRGGSRSSPPRRAGSRIHCPLAPRRPSPFPPAVTLALFGLFGLF